VARRVGERLKDVGRSPPGFGAAIYDRTHPVDATIETARRTLRRTARGRRAVRASALIAALIVALVIPLSMLMAASGMIEGQQCQPAQLGATTSASSSTPRS
jgi:cobalt-zinc-cadmium resistance protein CzcA